MEVDRAFVHGRVRALALDEPEERARHAVDDGERLTVSRSQRDARRRVVAALPDEAGGRSLELGKLRSSADGVVTEGRRVVIVDRRLERGREHMGVEDPWIRVVDDRRFDSPREQRVRLSSEELIERILARDEHREASSTTTCAAPLLPQRRDRAREARPRSRSRGGRCRSPARARPSRSRRADHPRRAGARSRAAAQGCTRPGRERDDWRSRCPRARP